MENEEIINNEKEICEIFNNFFSDIVTNLNIPKILCSVNVDSTDDTNSIAINKHKNHPSIKEIINKTPITQKCAFQQVNREQVKLEITNLDPSKAAQEGDKHTRIFKANALQVWRTCPLYIK